MNNSTHHIREWLSRARLLAYAGLFIGGIASIMIFGVREGSIVEAQGGLNLALHQAITNVAVTNGSASAFSNPLHRANFVQLTLNPGDAQVFTYCPPVGACAQVPSGQSYEIGPLREELTGGQALGTVQTATDGATLQVVAQRVRQ